MKGWILIALIAGVIYYFATETDKLDKPISDANGVITTVERKLDSVFGTEIIKVDNRIKQLKSQISERLSTDEQVELDDIFYSEHSIEDFKTGFCSSSNKSHPVFSKENLAYICDSL